MTWSWCLVWMIAVGVGFGAVIAFLLMAVLKFMLDQIG